MKEDLPLKSLLTKQQLEKFPGWGFGFGEFMKQRGAMAGHGC